MKFQNSSADERLQQVEQAELELVEVVEEDGDALCRLLNRCVAWLRPAKFCRGDADTCSHLVAWNAWVCFKKIPLKKNLFAGWLFFLSVAIL